MSAAKTDPMPSDRPIRLITNVELSEDPPWAPQLILYADDSAEDRVRAFCQEHGLGDDVVVPLLQHVLEELRKADEQAAQAAPAQDSSPHADSSGHAAAGTRKVLKKKKKRPEPAYNRLYEDADDTRRRHELLVLEAEREREAQRAQGPGARRKGAPAAEVRGDHLVDRLYRQGIQQRAIRTLEYEAARAEREEKMMSEYTFRPVISTRPAAGVQQKGPGWQRLWENAQQKQVSMADRMRQRQEDEERKEREACIFRPAIDENSRRMASQRVEALRENITVFDQLTQDAERRRLRAEQFEAFQPADATFQPKIDENSRMLALKHGKPTSTMSQFNGAEAELPEGVEVDEHPNISSHNLVTEESGEGSSSEDVVERLNAHERVRLRRIEEAQQQKEALQMMDPVTGQPLFHPVIRRPNANREDDMAGLPVGEYLYQKGLENLRRKEMAAQQREPVNLKYMSKESTKYLAKLRLRRFEQIFEYIAENQGAGEVVNVTKLVEPGNPVLESMDPEVRMDVEDACRLAIERAVAASPNRRRPKGDVTVNPRGFVEAMTDAIDANPGQRTYLLPVTRVRALDQNITFKPKINDSSAEMARAKRQGISVFDALFEEGKVAEERRKAQKQRIEDEQLKAYTFKPKINASGAVSKVLRSSFNPGPAPGVPKKVYNAVAAPSMRLTRPYEDVNKEVMDALQRAGNEAVSRAARGGRPKPEPHPLKEFATGRDSEEDAFDFGAGAAGGSALSNRLMESMQALLRAEEGEDQGNGGQPGVKAAWA